MGNGEWSKELVLELLIDLHQKGVKLHADKIKRAYKSLFFYAVQYFGSWENAISELRVVKTKITYCKKEPSNMKWSKERVLDEIKEYHNQGYKLNAGFVLHEYSSLYHNARIYFDTWKIAITSAGLDYNQVAPKKYSSWSKERVLKEIIGLYEKGKKINTSSVDIKLYHYGRKYFGSWKGTIEACGLNYDEVKSGDYKK